MKFDLPTVILIILLIGFIYMVWKVSRGKSVNFADMFKGDGNMASASRFIALGGWVFATWLLLALEQDSADKALEFGKWYLGICVAGYAANKLSESIGGK